MTTLTHMIIGILFLGLMIHQVIHGMQDKFAPAIIIFTLFGVQWATLFIERVSRKWLSLLADPAQAGLYLSVLIEGYTAKAIKAGMNKDEAGKSRESASRLAAEMRKDALRQ